MSSTKALCRVEELCKRKEEKFRQFWRKGGTVGERKGGRDEKDGEIENK